MLSPPPQFVRGGPYRRDRHAPAEVLRGRWRGRKYLHRPNSHLLCPRGARDPAWRSGGSDDGCGGRVDTRSSSTDAASERIPPCCKAKTLQCTDPIRPLRVPACKGRCNTASSSRMSRALQAQNDSTVGTSIVEGCVGNLCIALRT